MNNESVKELKSKIRVLITCSQKITLRSLTVLIESNRDMTVGGYIDDFKRLPEMQDSLKSADVVLICLDDKDTETVEIISKLLAIAPNLRVIIITSNKDFSNQTRAIRLGAVGIVQKEQSSKVLIEAVRQTFRGEIWINQQMLTQLLNNKNHKTPKNQGSKSWDLMRAEALTPREKEVIQLIGKGLKNKEIADVLSICEATVRHHLSSIYGKLDVDDRLNLVIYAYQQGLISLSEPENEVEKSF